MQLNIKNQLINVIKMDWIEQFLVTFLSFISALGVYGISQWYLNKKEKEKVKIIQNNFLTLIEQEIIFNRALIKEMLKMNFAKVLPTAKLKTENRDGCWVKVIEYRHKTPELINNISHLYVLFELINKNLEMVPFYFSEIQDTSKHMINIKNNIEKISKTSENFANKAIELIEKEISKK